MLAHTPPAHIQRGFTLIELMVVVALLAILGALAAPSFQSFTVKNNMRNMGAEFSNAVLMARNTAISRNTCVTLCMSSTSDTAAPTCLAAGDDWQRGWIAFVNPTCNNTLTTPAIVDVIVARGPITRGNYFMTVAGATANQRRITFSPRGTIDLGSMQTVSLIFESPTDPNTLNFGYSVCLDRMGRTRNC